jgi:hypothetical protein
MKGIAISTKSSIKKRLTEMRLISFILGELANMVRISESRKYVKCSELPSRRRMITKLLSPKSSRILG